MSTNNSLEQKFSASSIPAPLRYVMLATIFGQEQREDLPDNELRTRSPFVYASTEEYIENNEKNVLPTIYGGSILPEDALARVTGVLYNKRYDDKFIWMQSETDDPRSKSIVYAGQVFRNERSYKPQKVIMMKNSGDMTGEGLVYVSVYTHMGDQWHEETVALQTHSDNADKFEDFEKLMRTHPELSEFLNMSLDNSAAKTKGIMLKSFYDMIRGFSSSLTSVGEWGLHQKIQAENYGPLGKVHDYIKKLIETMKINELGQYAFGIFSMFGKAAELIDKANIEEFNEIMQKAINKLKNLPTGQNEVELEFGELRLRFEKKADDDIEMVIVKGDHEMVINRDGKIVAEEDELRDLTEYARRFGLEIADSEVDEETLLGSLINTELTNIREARDRSQSSSGRSDIIRPNFSGEPQQTAA